MHQTLNFENCLKKYSSCSSRITSKGTNKMLQEYGSMKSIDLRKCTQPENPESHTFPEATRLNKSAGNLGVGTAWRGVLM